jgi:hypothetical protein
MIRLFSLEDDIEAKVIGRSYPQISDTPTEQLVRENMKQVEEEKFQDIPAGGYGVKISKSVRLTDYLSSFMVTNTSIVSEQFIQLLGSFTMPQHRVIPINIFRIKELVTEKKYFILQLFGNDIQNVNFKKSTYDFWMGGSIMDKSLLKYENYDDYMLKLEKDSFTHRMKVTNLVMKKSLQNQLFYLSHLSAAYLFVTEPLREAMDKARITGFIMKEVGYIED